MTSPTPYDRLNSAQTLEEWAILYLRNSYHTDSQCSPEEKPLISEGRKKFFMRIVRFFRKKHQQAFVKFGASSTEKERLIPKETTN